MKKFLFGFLAGALMFGSIGAFALSQYTAYPATFKVLVNGEDFISEPPALVVEGKTYLPLRAIGNALGIEVNWNAELNQAEVGEKPSLQEGTLSGEIVQQNDKWKMTYLNHKAMSKIDEYTRPTDGKEYLVTFFEIENISSESQNFSLFYTDFYIDDFKTPQTIVGYKIDDAMQLTATQVEPGKKAKGYFIFEVSPDWSRFDIVYNEDLLKKDNENVIKFTITR